MLQGRVNRQEGEWRIDVRQCEYNRERTVKQEPRRRVRDVQVLQQRVHHSVAAKDGLPRVGAHQVANPKRDDHKLIKQFFALRIKRNVIRQRIPQQQGQQRNPARDPHRPQQYLGVHRHMHQVLIILQSPVVHDGLPTLHTPEAVAEEQKIGRKQERADPNNRRQSDSRLVGARKH